MIAKEFYKNSIKYIELGLGIIVGIGVILYAFNSFILFSTVDWSQTETFYNFISTILLIFLGLELIRLMIFHSLNTVLELIILVIARKMLRPDIDAVSIFLGVVSITIIVGLIYFLHTKKIKSLEDLSQ